MIYDVDVTITYAHPGDVWPSRVQGRVGCDAINLDWWAWVEFYNYILTGWPQGRTFREVYV